jgi:hypothetical protein
MSMGKKSLLDKITGKKAAEAAVPQSIEAEPENQEAAGEVDHLWMKEDIDARKPTLEKDPRIDTGILRNRIADKIAKRNNS